MISIPLDTLLLLAIAVVLGACWWELRKQNRSDSGESVSDKVGTVVNIGGMPPSGAHDSHESDDEYEYEDKIGFGR